MSALLLQHVLTFIGHLSQSAPFKKKKLVYSRRAYVSDSSKLINWFKEPIVCLSQLPAWIKRPHFVKENWI